MSIIVDKKVKELSDLIAMKALKEAECYPIDRYFLEPYINDILKLDRNGFLLYNLERVNNNYTVNLLLCLPELWEDITVEDLIEIVNNFTNVFSFYALLLFTYKYVEVNFIEVFLGLDTLSFKTKSDIRAYLKSQYPNFLKSDGEIFVIDEDLIGVKNDDWMYIKQRLLLDGRIKPALHSLSELEDYIESI